MKEIERALAKAAIDNKDDRRTVQYGERVLASTPDDMLVLDRVARAQIAFGGKENAAKALAHARRFQEIVEKLPEATGLGAAKMREERDRGIARALLYQSRAQFLLGDFNEASKLAAQSFSKYPCEESAREWGAALASLGFDEQAASALRRRFHDPRYPRPGFRSRAGSKTAGRALSQGARFGKRPRRGDSGGVRSNVRVDRRPPEAAQRRWIRMPASPIRWGSPSAGSTGKN